MSNITIENRKAYYNYEVLETYTAGLILAGPEVVSIRSGRANIIDAYCYVTSDNQMIMTGMVMTIPAGTVFYTQNNNNTDCSRDIKLLLNKKEILDIKKETDKNGITVIPLKIFRTKNGLFKLQIGICKGKKEYDKRETIKERDSKRDLQRVMKNY